MRYMIDKENVIKQADTIEELCDYIVYVCNRWKRPIEYSKDNYEWAKTNYRNNKSMTVYLAIWTDKGLIYVAKMNKKGELELL